MENQLDKDNKERIDDACPFPPGIDPSKNRILSTPSPKFGIDRRIVLFTVSMVIIAGGLYATYLYIHELGRLKIYVGEGVDQVVLYDDEISLSYNFSSILSKKIYFDRVVSGSDYSYFSSRSEQRLFSSFKDAIDWIEVKVKTPKIVYGIYHTLMDMTLSEAQSCAGQAVSGLGNVRLRVGNLQGTNYEISKSENSIEITMHYNGNWYGWHFFIMRYIFPDRTTIQATYLFDLNY